MSGSTDGTHLVGLDAPDPTAGRVVGLRLTGVLLLGSFVFLVLFASASATQPTLTLNLSGDSRATLRNVYPVEHLDTLSWVWTGPRAELSLPSLDRRLTWHWSGRVLLNRPDGIPPPFVRITIDDGVAFEGTIAQDALIEFAIPRTLDRTGVVLAFDTMPGFVPGPDDPRELGIALASVSLRAERGSAPNTEVLLYGILAVGLLGIAFIVQRLRPEGILAGLLAVTVGQAWLLARDVTVHGAYPSRVVLVAAGTWLGITLLARAVDGFPAALSKTLPDAGYRALQHAGLVPVHLYRRVLDAIPESLLSASKRILTGAAYALPMLLVINAVGFWGRGVIDEEAMFFVLNYLADRPLVALVFDPLLNDWGAYQARELSYLFDLIDARVFASLLDRGVLLFIPLSGVLGLMAVGAIYIRSSRNVLQLDGVTASLLLSLFLSCIVTQASTAILYRSSKIVLSIALLAFLFHVTALVRATNGVRRASPGQLAGLFLLGFVMSIVDRQGFFYLAGATAIVTALWLTTHLRAASVRTNHVSIVATSLGALAAATFYNHIIAPAVIRWANGYSPGFEYQQLQLTGLLDPMLVEQAWTMFQAQASLFFGNVPFVLVGSVAASAWVAGAVRSRITSPGGTTVATLLTDDRLVITLASASALVVLLGLMILRHPPIYTIPDHAFWYYTLTIHVVFLFGLSLAVASLGKPERLRWRPVLYALLVAMIVGNVAHYGDHRPTMVDSGGWFETQYERSRRLVGSYEAAPDPDTLIPESATGEPFLAEVAQDEEHFLERVRIAYTRLMER